MIRGVISEVAYNVQATVDAKHKLPIDYEVTNQNDSRAMGNMARRAKTILGKNDFSILFDKGYHKGKELDAVQKLGITAHVSIPGIPKTSQAPNPAYNAENFDYHSDSDSYICPEGHTMHSSKRWYESPNYRFKHYKTKACSTCQVRDECTISKNGKVIHRSEYQHAVEQNKRNIENNPQLYRQRQSIVEHPFGTIKRQWGYDHIMTKKTKKHASADVGLIFIAYNLKRLFNILGTELLREFLTLTIASILSQLTTISHLPHYKRSKQIVRPKTGNKLKSFNLNTKPDFFTNLACAA
jgi:hypothetical protein